MFEQIKLYISNKWEKLYPLLFSSMICLLLYFFKDNEIIDKCYYKCFDKTFIYIGFSYSGKYCFWVFIDNDGNFDAVKQFRY